MSVYKLGPLQLSFILVRYFEIHDCTYEFLRNNWGALSFFRHPLSKPVIFVNFIAWIFNLPSIIPMFGLEQALFPI